MNVDFAVQAPYSVSCVSEEGEGASIYQWVVSTQDSAHYAFSQHTVCRQGSLWNRPPLCPWMYCLNDECSVCEENWADEFDSIVDMNAEPDSLDKERAIFIEDDGIDDEDISEDEIDDLDL